MIKKILYIFKRKPKAILLNNEFRIVPAFTWKGVTYYMHEEPLNTATGRGLTALVFMEELLMRCSINYLNNHAEAVDKILSDPKKINIGNLARLNQNLKERINFLAVVPAHLLKLASVVFFTNDESPFVYDDVYNKKKIEKWSKDESIYDFFLQQTQLKDLVPFLSLPQNSSQNYLAVQQKINTAHLNQLREVLFKSRLMPGNMN